MGTWTKAHQAKCAAHQCASTAVWHFEAGDVGSDYCDHHRDQIDDQLESDEDRAEFDVDDYDAFDDCGLMSDGQCSQAGTEHCDFCCPNRNSEFFAGSAAWRKKHQQEV